MEHKLALSVDTVFGLAFDIEKAPECKSGFKPAQFDLSAGKELFGDLRLNGFVALLRIGFAKRLIIVGGDEGRYRNEIPVINRADAIREMLVCDFNINPNCVLSIPSSSNTGGNINAIEVRVRIDTSCAVVSNFYHLPRIYLDLMARNLVISVYPSEAFWILEEESRKDDLIERFGGGLFAERVAQEIQGIAHKLCGTYSKKEECKNGYFSKY